MIMVLWLYRKYTYFLEMNNRDKTNRKINDANTAKY